MDISYRYFRGGKHMEITASYSGATITSTLIGEKEALEMIPQIQDLLDQLKILGKVTE